MSVAYLVVAQSALGFASNQFIMSSMMKIQIFISIYFLVLNLSKATSTEIPCGSVSYYYWFSSEEHLRTCELHISSTIDSNRTTIEADEEIGIIYFRGNKKIEFLPIEIQVSFPYLQVYEASDCSIKTISKANFNYLSMMRHLYLHANQIETIKSDTFEDMSTSLVFVTLNDNKIKSMNGQLFAFFRQLLELTLLHNECIHENFKIPINLTAMQERITEKCGYNEDPKDEGLVFINDDTLCYNHIGATARTCI